MFTRRAVWFIGAEKKSRVPCTGSGSLEKLPESAVNKICCPFF